MYGLSLATLALGLLPSALAQAASYSPELQPCSGNILTRAGSPLAGNQSLPQGEAAYVSARRAGLAPQWQSYLGGLPNLGYEGIASWTDLPNLGIAVSGGGYRASLFGAGTLSGLTSGNSSSVAPLLELATYLSGLSGGSWVVGSLAMHDYPEIWDMVLNEEDGWLLDLDLLLPDGLLGLSDNSDYYSDIKLQVSAKADEYPTTITDTWGRALSYHFFNSTTRTNFYENEDSATSHDGGLLWSSQKLLSKFASAAAPMPIVVTTSRVSVDDQVTGMSTSVIPIKNTQFEFTPFSFGSFDPSLSAYVPVENAGTYLANGIPLNGSSCAVGYENAGFVIGTSASLFNAAADVILPAEVNQVLDELEGSLSDVAPPGSTVPLVANWPNSFFNFTPEAGQTFESSENEILQLTDGGMNGENIPIAPLLVKSRAVDVILAIDASADTDYSFPNGTSMITTSRRLTGPESRFPEGWVGFPTVPADFVAAGIDNRISFFGCNSSSSGNATDAASYPLVIYLPNAPVNPSVYMTNTSTFKLDYTTEEARNFLTMAQTNAVTGWSGTFGVRDTEFSTCLGCALVDRARKRSGVARSANCETCFSRYCYVDGQTESASSSAGGAATAPPAAAATSTGGATKRSVAKAGGFAAVMMSALASF